MTKVIQTPSKNSYRLDFNLVTNKNSLDVVDLSIHNSEGQNISLSQIDEMEAFFIEMELKYVIMDIANIRKDNEDDE